MFSQVPSNIRQSLKMHGFVRVDGLRNDKGKIIEARGKYHNTHGRMRNARICLVIGEEIWITGNSNRDDAVARQSVVDDWARYLHLNPRRPSDFPDDLHRDIKTSELLQRLANPDYRPNYTL